MRAVDCLARLQDHPFSHREQVSDMEDRGLEASVQPGTLRQVLRRDLDIMLAASVSLT
jgi:hypothetical protein